MQRHQLYQKLSECATPFFVLLKQELFQYEHTLRIPSLTANLPADVMAPPARKLECLNVHSAHSQNKNKDFRTNAASNYILIEQTWCIAVISV